MKLSPCRRYAAHVFTHTFPPPPPRLSSVQYWYLLLSRMPIVRLVFVRSVLPSPRPPGEVSSPVRLGDPYRGLIPVG